MLPDEDELPMMEAHHIDALTGEDELAEGAAPDGYAWQGAQARCDPKNPETWGKVGRNDPCPCGSGKKYKHCHGAYV